MRMRLLRRAAAFFLMLLPLRSPLAHGAGRTRCHAQHSPRRQATLQPQTQTRCPAAPAPGAQPARRQRRTSTTPTIKVEANEVDLVFTVTDKKGHFVTGLNQSSFGLLDNGRPPEAGAALLPADESAAARGHHAGHQQLHPRTLRVRAGLGDRVPAAGAAPQRPRLRRRLRRPDRRGAGLHQQHRSAEPGHQASCVRAAARRCSTRSTRPARTRC